MKYLFIAILCLWGKSSYEQTYKFKTTKVKVVVKDKNSDFSACSDWEKVSVVVTINRSDKKIHIYDAEDQDFDVLKVEDSWTDEYKGEWHKLYCLNKEGKKCYIRECALFNPKDETKYMLYIDYSDTAIIFAMKED